MKKGLLASLGFIVVCALALGVIAHEDDEQENGVKVEQTVEIETLAAHQFDDELEMVKAIGTTNNQMMVVTTELNVPPVDQFITTENTYLEDDLESYPMLQLASDGKKQAKGVRAAMLHPPEYTQLP